MAPPISSLCIRNKSVSYFGYPKSDLLNTKLKSVHTEVLFDTSVEANLDEFKIV